MSAGHGTGAGRRRRRRKGAGVRTEPGEGALSQSSRTYDLVVHTSEPIDLHGVYENDP